MFTHTLWATKRYTAFFAGHSLGVEEKLLNDSRMLYCFFFFCWFLEDLFPSLSRAVVASICYQESTVLFRVRIVRFDVTGKGRTYIGSTKCNSSSIFYKNGKL